MSLRNAIDAATARLAAVPNIKNVYSYRREARSMDQFLALFKDPTAKNIHAWMVTREATATVDEESQAYSRTHTIVMLGYLSVNDLANSEGTFQDLIEDACAAFDPLNARQYGGQFNWSTGLSVDGPTTLMYGAVLCHACKLTTNIREYPLI